MVSAGLTEKDSRKKGGLQFGLPIALLLTLPGLESTLFGLTYFFIPLAVFFYLYKWENGMRFVGVGLVLAAGFSLVTGALSTLLFTSTFIPVGYILALSAFSGYSPVYSGFRGTVSLVLCWGAMILGITVITGINPITNFLGSVDSGIEDALLLYRQTSSVQPETIALIEQSFEQIRTILPGILPSIIAVFALLIVWFTMIAGNHFVSRFTGYRPWSDYRSWQLPEKLIWVLIGSTIISLLSSGSLRTVGINALIIFCFIYFFQGFSIFSFYLDKWKIPLVLRMFLYGMMLFQSIGTLLLLLVGIGDVWFDLRHQRVISANNDIDNDHKE